MAQGFVKNLNLVESSSRPSDAGILNNLGGLGIADDIGLFDGNTKFKSRLVNDPNFIGRVKNYGFFEEGVQYKILVLGEDRGWPAVGWQANDGQTGEAPEVDDLFTANFSGENLPGVGGIAVEVLNRRDMNAENDPIDGWTIVTDILDGKNAFTDGTLLQKDNEPGFNYEVFNSDGNSRFQIRSVATQQTLDLSDIATFKLTRTDAITTENVRKLIVASPPIRGEVQSEDDEVEPYPSPFDPDGRIESIEGVISNINFKKSNVVLSYRNNFFDLESGVVFGGAISVENLSSIRIGIDTDFNQLVVGELYQVVALGTGAFWDQVGANVIDENVSPVSSGSFDTTSNDGGGVIYVIENLGVDARGTNGAFTFGVGDMDGGSNEIDLGSGHGLVVGDKLRLTKTADDDNISGLPVNADYFVVAVVDDEIQLSTSSGGSIQEFETPSTGTNYTLTIDPQKAWNVIGNTSSLNSGAGITYEVGDFFTANTNGSTISNAVVYPVIFKATAVVNTSGTNGKAKALEPPGLYIHNVMTDEAKRAFTGKDNPWQDSNVTIANTVGGASYSLSALTTSSAVAQAGDFNLKRSDETDWGSFIPGENYTITDIGNGSRDWNALANTTGLNYEVGDTFEASVDGSSLNAGSGGKAIGEPKLIFTNENQNSDNGTYGNDGLGDFSGNIQASGANITHKIPIYVNDELYYLCASSTPTDVTNGDYKILVKPD
jgi:uncharacterized protein YaiE (UPF0345 family)